MIYYIRVKMTIKLIKIIMNGCMSVKEVINISRIMSNFSNYLNSKIDLKQVKYVATVSKIVQRSIDLSYES